MKNKSEAEDIRRGQEGMDTEGPSPQKRHYKLLSLDDRNKDEGYDEGGEAGETDGG